VQPRDARAYVERGWSEAERLKREHWAREYRARGSVATVDAAQALWAHMRAARPDWPTDADRGADLDHHVALKRSIDRAARVFADVAAR
jgi:hypothetical protein